MMKPSNYNEKELVSVIVPVYNVEKYVGRCLQTIMQQTYQNIEIIIVDDGSPDRSGLICEEIAQKDSRIRVIHQENQGLSGARNTGIEAANGAYLAFVDSDDWIRSEMIEVLYNLMQQTDAEIGACGTEICSDSGHVAYYSDNQEEVCVFTRNEAMQELLEDHRIRNVTWNKLYRKAVFEEVRFPRGMIFEDIATTYKVLDLAERVAYCGRPLYCYYKSEESIIRSNFSAKKFDKVIALKMRAEFYKSHYPEQAGKASETYVKSALNCLVGSYGQDELNEYRQAVRTELLDWLRENPTGQLPPKDRLACRLLERGIAAYDATITRACLLIGKFQNNTKRMGK